MPTNLKVELIGDSQEVRQMRKFAEKAGKSNHTLLLQGQTGTGKDLFAEFIHCKGEPGRFVPVDCGVLPETLSETELFGHVRGAFIDAQTPKVGLVEAARKGTLFLNEIGNLSLNLQEKFLRTLEKRSYRPVGSIKEMEVDTRIIAATNVDLRKAVLQGKFREDLYHRLNVVTYYLLPLTEHIEDLPALAEYFLRQEMDVNGGGAVTMKFAPDALKAMKDYNWPGNIRELQNLVKRLVFFRSDGGDIQAEQVQIHLKGRRDGEHAARGNRELPTLYETLDEAEKSYMCEVLRRAKGSITMAAKMAKVSRPSMYARMEKYGLKGYQNPKYL